MTNMQILFWVCEGIFIGVLFSGYIKRCLNRIVYVMFRTKKDSSDSLKIKLKDGAEPNIRTSIVPKQNRLWRSIFWVPRIFLSIFKYFFSKCFSKGQDLSTRPSELEINITTGKRGLRNLGNTCYLNSALQCLHKTFEIQLAGQKTQAGSDNATKAAFLTLFEELCHQREAFSPGEVKYLISDYNPMFQGFDQHDSGEVLGTVINMLHESMNEVKQISTLRISNELRRKHSDSEQLWAQTKERDQRREKSIIDDIIFGRYKTVYECRVCHELFILFEKYHAIYLNIAQKNGRTLEDCFEQFLEPELMEGESAMECARCQEDQPTDKTMVPYELNKILIVVLKRFFGGSTKKDERQVKIPFELSSETISKSQSRNRCRYELYGMINHFGRDISSGHYTSCCFDRTNGWVAYNDSQFTAISVAEAQRKARDAYVLLYRRK